MRNPRHNVDTEVRVAKHEQARIRRASARFGALDPKTGKARAVSAEKCQPAPKLVTGDLLAGVAHG